MTSPETMAREIRNMRSILLNLINAAYPNGVYEDDICESMLELPESVSPDNVRRDLAYMRARGLIAVENGIDRRKTFVKVKVNVWTLTGNGVTFIEHGMPWSEIEALT
jgi:predicted transcriptional regulator